MASTNRESVGITIRLLAISGIVLPTFVKKKSSLLKGYILMGISQILLGADLLTVAAYMYKYRHKFSEFATGLPYTCTLLTILYTFNVFNCKKKKLGYFFRRIDHKVFTYTQETQISTEYSWFYRESNTNTIYLLVFFYEFLGAIPCFFPLYDHFVLEKNTLSFPGWFPWDWEKHFLGTYLLEIIMVLSGIWAVFIIEMFILFAVIEFSRQTMRLCSALSSIEKRSMKAAMENVKDDNYSTPEQREEKTKKLFENEFMVNLKQCIQHHQKVVKLFRIFQSWFSMVFFSELLADSLSFAGVFYNLFQVNAKVGRLALIGSSFIFISTLFSRCLVGEIFSDMNEKIATVIFYEVRWYERNSSNKRLLSIFHSQVRRPMDLYALSVFKASFFTFTSLMKTTYSYLNILKFTTSFKNEN